MARYVRFRTNLRGPDATTPLGVFYAFTSLVDQEAIDSWTIDRADEVCDWFSDHLPVPRLTDSERRAVFWLRANCADMIRRCWELAGVLRENDVRVDLIRTDNPGRVCYEDRFQVAAVPWRGMRRSRRSC